MAADPINIVMKRHAVFYDGTNSADIVALGGFAFNNSAIDEAGVWTFQSPPDSSQRTVEPNNWIIYSQNAFEEAHTETSFGIIYQCNAICGD